MDLFDLAPGQRIAICGKTGSGKSTLARGYLAKSNYHWVIFNPKWSRAFRGLGGNVLSNITARSIDKSIVKNQFTILNFPHGWTAEGQDSIISYLIEKYEGIGICIDELYYIHTRGQPGPGVTGLLTRGRELRQSFIGCTQRPVWINKFIFSEADVIVEFQLSFLDDRKKLYEFIGKNVALDKREGYDFLYFDIASDKATIYRA